MELVDLDQVLVKWIENTFKQPWRPQTADREVHLYVNPSNTSEYYDALDGESLEKAAVEYNQRNRSRSIALFLLATTGMAVVALN